MMKEDRNVQLGDEICSWESMKMDASGGKLTEKETQVPVKKAFVEVKKHRKTRRMVPHNIGIMCLAEGIIKSFNFRSQTATAHSKVFLRAHIQFGRLSLAKLEQGPKYQRVFEKQHFELNCKLTLCRKARGKVRYVYSALCRFNLPV